MSDENDTQTNDGELSDDSYTEQLNNELQQNIINFERASRKHDEKEDRKAEDVDLDQLLKELEPPPKDEQTP